MRRKLLCLVMAIVIAVAMIGCSKTEAAETAAGREFTDDLGRTVVIPDKVEKIAVSGPLSQIYVYPLCGDMFAGFCTAFSSDAEKYIPSEFLNLPELGQLYGGKGTMDLESLLAAGPDVIIDVGQNKDGMKDDLDALSEQTGIPFVHIDASVSTAPEVYRKLGALTGRNEQAEILAAWCEETNAVIEKLMKAVDEDQGRISLLYCTGDEGLGVIAEGSFHAETINMMGNNLAKLDDVAAFGTGNEVDVEQLLVWDPAVILFEKEAAYLNATESDVWGQLSAVKNGNAFAAPYGPYGWLASPPSVQRYLGMLWLGELLYPEYTDYDLQEKITEYYELFYNYTLSAEDYLELTKYAM